jgi:F-type H+-transporting ATPase subunit delta
MAMATASRYARALADLAFDPKRGADPESVAVELALFADALEASGDLRSVLLSPAVAPARKRAVVAQLAVQGGISALVRNFLCVVIDHRRTAILSEIREAFRALVYERMGMVEADISAARELPDGQREKVAAGLGRLTGKRVRCRFSVDEGLIGGVVARIGSTIYDGSVQGQLMALRRRLME